ncbi:hypothetical protein Goshw_012330, partial [Gossypium schwendimanii]|nr:hypothetical protein [Gossypium schwendimanii]
STRKVNKFEIIRSIVGDGSSRKLVSYKDTLLGETIDKHDSQLLEDEEELIEMDSEGDEPIPNNDIADEEGVIHIILSKEEWKLIRSQWRNTLIVKMFGKTTGYQYLIFKLRQLWKPKGDLEFLAMQKWAPNFRASEVSFDFVAMWMRVPELLIEYYDPNILTKIGRSLGGLLWIDNFTMSSERGKITILCMQVNMNKPLRKSFMMEERSNTSLTRELMRCVFDEAW